MSPRGPAQIRDLMRKAHQQGWKIAVTGSGHLKWTPPWAGGGQIITSGSRLGGGRSVANTRAMLKSKGLKI